MTSVPAVRPAEAALPAFNLSNVRTLRLFAFALDAVVVVVLWWLWGALMVALAWPTYGASFGLAIFMPLIGVFYSGLTAGSGAMATFGMRAVGLKLSDTGGNPVGFIIAAGHALVLWLAITWSWGTLAAAMMAVSLFHPAKRAAHDLLTGVILSRR